MQKTGKGPWDLGLEVIGRLREPGCGWNYQVGFKTVWDGRRYPKDMCPFAWNAFSPWVWGLRYGSGDEDEVTFICPDPRHMVVFRVYRIKDDGKRAAETTEQGEQRVWKLEIEVDELPRGAGCDRGYRVGDSWVYDGDIPEAFCPLAWNALQLWVWPLRYGGSPEPMGWSGAEVKYACPNYVHPVVFRVCRVDEFGQVRGGA